MITYTFIIPHHNCPKLLDRCINSIPQREDIQIIVVDDNSDEDKKPIQCDRPEVEYIYIDKVDSKGAGRARNRGLVKAKGMWVVFSDSDDYFATEILNHKLDLYVNSDADIIYFNTNKLNADTLKPIKGNYEYHEVINKNNAESLEWLRYRSNVPWGKFIRKDLINKYNLCFSECIAGNDLFFSVKSGHYSTKTIIDTDIIYFWCIRCSGNISSNLSRDAVLSRYIQDINRNKFLLSVCKEKYLNNLIILYYSHFRNIGMTFSEIFRTYLVYDSKKHLLKHFLLAFEYFCVKHLKKNR